MTDKIKTGLKKAAEIIMYLIIGALVTTGILKADKIKEILSKTETTKVETASATYTTETTTVKTETKK